MTTFRTVLEATGGNNVGIVVPESTVLAFNRGKRVPVIVTIDGGYTYNTTIGVRGGRYLVSFNAETRKQTGLGAGDDVEVELVADPERQGSVGRSPRAAMRRNDAGRSSRCCR